MIQHKELAAGRWQKMPLVEQLAHVGSEVERALKWREKNDPEYSRMAADRALELLDLTLDCTKGYTKLKEVARVREALVDYFYCDNSFKSTPESWRKYFMYFAYAARRNC
jgi:hypothetical protein